MLPDRPAIRCEAALAIRAFIKPQHASAPHPRWGDGKPPHSELRAAIERNRSVYDQSLNEIGAQRAALGKVAFKQNRSAPFEPFWENPWFSTLDAAALVAFLLSRKPRRYVEIGSGHSTMFARFAIKAGNLATTITSIDPKPRAEVDALCDRVLRRPLENCEQKIFDEIEAGDILFFDGSHRVLMNSDVVVFFLEILPRLKPGILVHVHDIFLPDDYPKAWSRRFYTEQYLLAAMLLCGSPPFRIVLPNYFVCTDEVFADKVHEIFKGEDGEKDIPHHYPIPSRLPGVSFWLETAGVREARPGAA
jgi:hypothetical protein